MTGIPAPRLDELLENLSTMDTAPVHEWIQDYEEAMRLATYSGQSDTVSFLIDGYLNSFHPPVPLEVRFYCVFYEAVKHWRAGSFQEARSRYSTAREIALSGGDEMGAARCLMALGVTLWAEGDHRSAFPVLEEAEEVLRQVRDITLSNCLNWLGVVCGNLELLSRAWKYYREALELNRELGLTQSQSFLLCNMGLLCQQMGLYDQAEESYRESLELQKQCGNRYGYADSLANLGMLVLKKHRKPEDAFRMLLEAAEMQLENDDINRSRTCGEIYGYCSHEVSGRAVSDLLIPIVPGNDTCSLMEMCLQESRRFLV